MDIICIGSPMLGVVGFGIVECEIYFIYYSDIYNINIKTTFENDYNGDIPSPLMGL